MGTPSMERVIMKINTYTHSHTLFCYRDAYFGLEKTQTAFFATMLKTISKNCKNSFTFHCSNNDLFLFCTL